MPIQKSTLKKVAVALSLAALAVGADLALRAPWFDRLVAGGPPPVIGRLTGPPEGTIAPEPGLTIAFIGDTGTGRGFRQVLQLIKREGAHAVVHLGDAIYENDAARFWAVVDELLGHDYPYLLTQGNHDLDRWPEMAPHAFEHVKRSGALTDATGMLDPRLALTFRGVSLMLLGEAARDDDPARIVERFSRDRHIWKICGWHKNQNRLQVGGKDDEMGWGVYEACRQMGAMIQTGHEHSYHRTKTLASTVEQRVDPGCSDPARLCVRPGAVPVFVTGLGGRSIRDQERCLPATYPYGCNGEWAFIYTSNQGAKYGALFITFHLDGDARKARGRFTNVDGQVVDSFQLQAQ
jgi:hypothetical protein